MEGKVYIVKQGLGFEDCYTTVLLGHLLNRKLTHPPKQSIQLTLTKWDKLGLRESITAHKITAKK